MEDDTRTARERTLAHLDDLMRAAVTTVGAGVLLASSAQAPPPPPWRSIDPAWRCLDPDELLAKGCVAATDNGLVLMLAPKENETSAGVQFPPKCSAKKVALKLSLDLKEKPAEGRSIPVKQVK